MIPVGTSRERPSKALTVPKSRVRLSMRMAVSVVVGPSKIELDKALLHKQIGCLSSLVSFSCQSFRSSLPFYLSCESLCFFNLAGPEVVE
jgi:hypothetical protein